MGFSSVVGAGLASSFYGCAIAAEAIGQETGDSTDRGDTDAGQVVDLPVGQVLLEVFHDLPAIDQGLQLGGRAEILEEISTLGGRLEADYGVKQGIFSTLLLSLGFVTIGFHVASMY